MNHFVVWYLTSVSCNRILSLSLDKDSKKVVIISFVALFFRRHCFLLLPLPRAHVWLSNYNFLWCNLLEVITVGSQKQINFSIQLEQQVHSKTSSENAAVNKIWHSQFRIYVKIVFFSKDLFMIIADIPRHAHVQKSWLVLGFFY